MTVERLTDGAIGVRCDKCHTSAFFNAAEPVTAAANHGWYVEGTSHDSSHLCPKCAKGGEK